jgi:HAD superfamily hydrolase (TIGR01509 family)
MDALYVDLDGTLVTFERSFAEILYDALDRVGADASDEQLEAFGAALGDALDAADDPYAAAAEAALPVEPAAFSEAMLAAEPAATVAVPGARDVLETVSEDGDYRLGVLTNGYGPMQRGKLAAAGLADHVETVVVSGEVGVGKPDPGIFDAAEDKLPADAYTFVADSLDRDVRAAERAGWRGVYVGEETPDDVANVEALVDVPDVV